jgi:hypothetical protein
MMSKRSKRFLFLLVAAALLVCASLAFLDSVRYPVLGWLRGEPFFEGMPASWYADCYARKRSFDDPVPALLARFSARAAQRWAEAREREWRRVARMEIQPEGLPVLRWLAQQPDQQLRYEVLCILERQGPAALPALDVVSAALADESARCRVVAAFAVARIDTSRQREAVRLLLRAMALDQPSGAQALAGGALMALKDEPAVRELLCDLFDFPNHPSIEGVQGLRSRRDLAAALRAKAPWDGRIQPYYHYRACQIWLGAVGQPHAWPRIAAALAAAVECRRGAAYDSAASR